MKFDLKLHEYQNRTKKMLTWVSEEFLGPNLIISKFRIIKLVFQNPCEYFFSPILLFIYVSLNQISDGSFCASDIKISGHGGLRGCTEISDVFLEGWSLSPPNNI